MLANGLTGGAMNGVLGFLPGLSSVIVVVVLLAIGARAALPRQLNACDTSSEEERK